MPQTSPWWFFTGPASSPNETLTIDTASGPECGKQKATATPDGTYTAVIGPVVKRQQSGKASVTVTSQKCSVAVQFPWGGGSYRLQ